MFSQVLPDWSVLKQPYNYQIYGGHTPLGELWANKMDLLPAIFKTGVVVAVALVILKVIFGLLLFKQTLFIKKLAALAKLGAGVGALAVKAPLAVKATLGDEKAAEEPSRKRRSGSPVVDSETDLEEMASQLDSILEGFDPKEDWFKKERKKHDYITIYVIRGYMNKRCDRPRRNWIESCIRRQAERCLVPENRQQKKKELD